MKTRISSWLRSRTLLDHPGSVPARRRFTLISEAAKVPVVRTARSIVRRSEFVPSLYGTGQLGQRRQSTAAATAIHAAVTPQPSSSSNALPQIMVNDMSSQEVLVDFNGTALRFPSFWLRDHCPCPACQHPSTHQRLLDTFTIDPEIKVSGVEATPVGLSITWPAIAGQDAHCSTFAWEWLQSRPPFIQANSASKQSKPQRSWTFVPPSTTSLPRVPYDQIMSIANTAGLKSFLQTIRTQGYCFIPSTPRTPEATQSLVERIAHIRPTHYGGFWDFTSQPNPIDTAYTDDYLPPHTDTTYFTDPAGLQLFHCLQPATQGGGESTLVDGFAAAQHLYETHPEYYRTLGMYPITSAALGSSAGSFFNTASSQRGYPVFIHSSSSPGIAHPSPTNLVQIRWNNLDRVTPTVPSFPNHTALKSWYAAAREWARILESKEFLVTVQLQPGEPVIFDNWRILHGRLAFKGGRRVCGAYVGMDDFLAKCRGLGIDA
jgi:trimethyllysine dioxygenase